MIPRIKEEYIIAITYAIPYVFSTPKAGIIGLGIYLFVKPKNKYRFDSLEER